MDRSLISNLQHLVPTFDSLRSRLTELLDSPTLAPPDAERLRAVLSELAALQFRLDQSLEETRQQARAADDARAKFISTVSHELKLPMTSIKGYGDLMRQELVGPINDQQRQFLEIIRSNVDRMAALVSDLADISKMDTGRLRLDLTAVEPAECIERATEAVQSAVAAKRQTLETQVPAGLPLVRADRSRLVEVLAKLLDNARKYTPPEGHVAVAAEMEGTGRLRFWVTDTGIGIRPEERDRLFSQFFRAELPAVREHPGWGLSLHVCRRLVHLMGGEMGVESEPNQGTRFWFALPVVGRS